MAQTEGCGTSISDESKSDKINGVVVRIENGPKILFIDLNGNESIAELLKSPKLAGCDLYVGEFVVEGQKAPIHKIANIEKNYYIVAAKYAKYAKYEQSKSVVSTYDATRKYKIGMLGRHSKWICHDANGKVVCNRDKCQIWEQFISVPIKNNWVAFKSYHNQYLSARADGSITAVHHCQAWEFFQVIPNKDGTVSFRSHHNKFLSAQPDGRLQCNRAANNVWEHFKIKIFKDMEVEEKERKDVKCNEEPYKSMYDPNKKCQISLFGCHNKYVCAELNCDGKMVCNRDKCLGWERFWSIPMGNGLIGLYCHGKYVSAEPSGKVIANRSWCKEWEQFKVIQNKNATFALQSCHGKYLSAQPNGSLECNRDNLAVWEQFKINMIQ